MADAIQYAGAHGVVFVAAAGNESVNNDVVRSYPASYRFANVISVAAIDSAGTLARFSNFGRTTVDVAAPGVGILSTVPGGGYASFSGTSMATPHVSGVVALLVAQHPEYSAAQLVQRVLGTTKPLAGLAARTVTGGLVDAAGVAGPGRGAGLRPPGGPCPGCSRPRSSRRRAAARGRVGDVAPRRAPDARPRLPARSTGRGT